MSRVYRSDLRYYVDSHSPNTSYCTDTGRKCVPSPESQDSFVTFRLNSDGNGVRKTSRWSFGKRWRFGVSFGIIRKRAKRLMNKVKIARILTANCFKIRISSRTGGRFSRNARSTFLRTWSQVFNRRFRVYECCVLRYYKLLPPSRWRVFFISIHLRRTRSLPLLLMHGCHEPKVWRKGRITENRAVHEVCTVRSGLFIL